MPRRSFTRNVSLALLAGLLPSCGSTTEIPVDPSRLTIELRSSAFADGSPIPAHHTCDGKDVSPALSWSGVPSSARSLALLCDDPDAPGGTWSHWVVAGLPPSTTELAEGIPRGESAPGLARARQGRNDFGAFGYGGPCPPAGTHHYVFRILALDIDPSPDSMGDRVRLMEAARGHVVAEGRLTGTYAR